MADFRTHMLTSTTVGAIYGLVGFKLGLPWQTCVVAGGLCSVSGMLPDLDSDSGRPLREATTLAAAVVPMLMVERFQRFGWGHETMVLAAGVLYLFIRFGLTEIFRRFTVHRGMWHSVPAAVVVGMISFLVMDCEDITLRIFKTMAVVSGFMSHLILDEIWSVDFKRGQYKFKSSFGTALKLWGNDRWANFSTYFKLVGLSYLVYQDQAFMNRFGPYTSDVPHTARELWQIVVDGGWLR
ncbi:MAG: metal-dependent hydrolase [Pirellulaceae bacterium]|nr:metal-dependent hydrolase [Pirellulaceae bacterium]